jgi:hypothetical protein
METEDLVANILARRGVESVMNGLNHGTTNLLRDHHEIHRVIPRWLPLELLLVATLGLVGYHRVILGKDETIGLVDTGGI